MATFDGGIFDSGIFDAGTGTVLASFSAAAVVSKAQSGQFSANAVIRATASGSATVDSVTAKTIEGSFAAEAEKSGAVVGSFAADAIIEVNWGPWSDYESGHTRFTATIDAQLVLHAVVSLSADASIRKTWPGSLTADAVIAISRPGSFTVNAQQKLVTQLSLSADAIIWRHITGSLTANAEKVDTYRIGSLTANAIIFGSRSGSVSVDAQIIFQRVTTGFSADAVLLRTSQVSWESLVRAAGDPILWFRLVETSGDFINSGSIAQPATSIVNATRGVAGRVDQAVSFSGTGYAATASYAIPLNNVLTFEAWIYLNSGGVRRSIISSNNTAGPLNVEIDASNRVSVWNTTAYIAVSTSTIPIGQWVHIAYTRSGTGSGTHKIYINGVSSSLVTNGSTNFVDNSSLKFLGARTASTQRWSGKLDEIIIYPRVLSQDEVQAHYLLTGPPIFTARAVLLKPGITGSFTANSLIIAGRFTVDAIKYASITGTKTANALLRKRTEVTLTADAFINGKFSIDAILFASSGTKTLAVDAEITEYARISGSFTANAELGFSGDFTVDASIAAHVDLGAEWEIGETAQTDLTMSWDVGDLSSGLQISWAIGEPVSNDLTASWAIDTPVSPDPYALTTRIMIEGVDVTANVDIAKSYWEMAAGPNPGTAKVYILDLGHDQSISVGDEMTLDIGELRVWGGYVMGLHRGYAFSYQDTTDATSVPRYWILDCSDYNILFTKRYVYNKATPTAGIDDYAAGTHDDVIVKEMVSDYLDLSGDGISTRRVNHVGTPLEDAKGAPLVPAIQFGQAMRNIALMPGAIFYIDADRVLNYADVDVIDAPFRLSDQPNNTTSFGYRELELIEDGTNLGNDALVWGAALGVDTMTFKRYQDSASISDHGRWQWADFRRDLYKPESVLKRATTFVDGSTQNNRGHKDDAISIRCSVIRPGLRAGMKVHFTCNTHGYVDVIPIRTMRIKFVNPNEAIYELYLAHYLDEAWNTAEFKNPPGEGGDGCQPVNMCEELVVVTGDGSSSPSSGWNTVFYDDFKTWDPSRYFVYPSTWTNGYTGHYDPSIISSDGDKLRIYIHTEGGYPRIAAFIPLVTGALSNRGDLMGMRATFRLRADSMPGYKGVPLLWPIAGHSWPEWGEIDFPEGHFDAQPAAFMHRQDATVGWDQDYFNTPNGTSWQDWHTYTIEWSPDSYVKFAIDSYVIGTSTSRIPKGAMHLVMQFETQLNMTPPSPSVSGYVEIDWLQVEAYGGAYGGTGDSTHVSNPYIAGSVTAYTQDGRPIPVVEVNSSTGEVSIIGGIDTFENRTVPQALGADWGQASSGLTWEESHAGPTTMYSAVSNGMGVMSLGTGGTWSAMTQWIFSDSFISGFFGSDFDITVTFSFDQGPTIMSGDRLHWFLGYTTDAGAWSWYSSSGNIGYTHAIEFWWDTNDLLSGIGVTTDPGDAADRTPESVDESATWAYGPSFVPDVDVQYTVRWKRTGMTVQGKIWVATDPEPEAWDVESTVTDDFDVQPDTMRLSFERKGSPAIGQMLRIYDVGGDAPDRVIVCYDVCDGQLSGITDTFSRDVTCPTIDDSSVRAVTYAWGTCDASVPWVSYIDEFPGQYVNGVFTRYPNYQHVRNGDGYIFRSWIQFTSGNYNDSRNYLYLTDYDMPSSLRFRFMIDVQGVPHQYGTSNMSFGCGTHAIHYSRQGLRTWKYVNSVPTVIETPAEDRWTLYGYLNNVRYTTYVNWTPTTDKWYELLWEFGSTYHRVRIWETGDLEPETWLVEQTISNPPTKIGSFSINVSQYAGNYWQWDGVSPAPQPGVGPGWYADQDIARDFGVHFDSLDIPTVPSQALTLIGTGDVYRPRHVRQLGWGTAFDGLNCTMASACIALDRHTMGAMTATPPEMRAEQLDQSGGTDLGDAKYAWNHGWNQNLNVQYGLSWSTFVSMVNNGRGAIVQGMYSEVPAPYTSQSSFDGPHAVYVNEFNATGQALVYDPLATGPRWWPVAVLQDYALTFGGGSVSAGFTQITG